MEVSWIEPEEVASVAESLRPPVHAQVVVRLPPPMIPEEAVEPLVIEKSQAAEDQVLPDLAAFRQRLQSIRERAIRAGLLTPQMTVPEVVTTPLPTVPGVVEVPSPVETAYEPEVPVPSPPPQISIASGASVKDRLEAFSLWSAQQWGPGELLIVDEYGDLLFGPPKKSGLVLSTMMAWNAAIRASAQAASDAALIQQQTLATGESLTIIPCQTRLGTLQIALVKAQAPLDQETKALKDALTQVMDMTG